MAIYSRAIDYSPDDNVEVHPKYKMDYIPEGYDHNLKKLESTVKKEIEEDKKEIKSLKKDIKNLKKAEKAVLGE